MDSLEQQNQLLRVSLQDLYGKAAENQRILQHFQSFELQLLSCRLLNDLLTKLLVDIRTHFELVACRLLWFDPEYSIRELVDLHELEEFDGALEFVRHPGIFQKIYGDDYRPVLKQLSDIEKARWFPWVPEVESCAMLPLVRDNTIIGSLHMGSSAASRFTPDKAVDFMARLASIIAVCLENSVSQEHLRRLSLIDMLTRVKNRRAFESDLDRELSRASRSNKALSCLFVDVDYFKQVNDKYGHQAGDQALRQVAQTIQKQLRQTDHLARYGGEEFAALLPDCPKDTALHIAERIRAAMETMPIQCEGLAPFSVTASIGISTWEPKYETRADDWIGQRLVAKADSAVYEAKNRGRNRVCFHRFGEAGASALVTQDAG